MAELVASCPRCGAAHITFDVLHWMPVGRSWEWQIHREAFSICRSCKRSTVFKISDRDIREARELEKIGTPDKLTRPALNDFVKVDGYVIPPASKQVAPPDHLPAEVERVFSEGTKCLSVDCPNAGATMFRLCLDMATQALLPAEDVDGLNRAIRRSLGLRLKWLFETGRLPDALEELSHAVKEDGNDGAHEGTLSLEDAADLLDFTVALLERLYTEPKRLALMRERRDKRRAAKGA